MLFVDCNHLDQSDLDILWSTRGEQLGSPKVFICNFGVGSTIQFHLYYGSKGRIYIFFRTFFRVPFAFSFFTFTFTQYLHRWRLGFISVWSTLIHGRTALDLDLLRVQIFSLRTILVLVSLL